MACDKSFEWLIFRPSMPLILFAAATDEEDFGPALRWPDLESRIDNNY